MSWFRESMGSWGIEALGEELGVDGTYAAALGETAVACRVVVIHGRAGRYSGIEGEYVRDMVEVHLRLSEVAPSRGGIVTADGVSYALLERLDSVSGALEVWAAGRQELRSTGRVVEER